MNEEQMNAAKAAWHRDPETAAQALLGMGAEEVFVQALRGCNQHKHKPGCPDAEGGDFVSEGGANRKQTREAIFAEYAERLKKINERYAGQFNPNRHELEEKIAELDAETLAKLKEKGVNA